MEAKDRVQAGSGLSGRGSECHLAQGLERAGEHLRRTQVPELGQVLVLGC